MSVKSSQDFIEALTDVLKAYESVNSEAKNYESALNSIIAAIDSDMPPWYVRQTALRALSGAGTE